MARPIQYNLKNVHYAKAAEDGLGGLTYGSPKPLPGAVSLTLTPEGDKTEEYAEGIVWYVSTSNQGYSGNLEVIMLTDEFRKEILGEEEDENAHVLIENAFKEPARFALMFQADKSDGTPVLFYFYNCVASRPDTGGETNTKTKSIRHDTIPISAAPVMEGYVRTKSKLETPTALLQNWFKQVWKPGDPVPASPLGTLIVTSMAGTNSGDTAVTVSPAKESGNIYRIKTAANVTVPAYDEDCSGSGWKDWDGTADITAATGDKLLVVECTAGGKARKSGTASVTAKA